MNFRPTVGTLIVRLGTLFLFVGLGILVITFAPVVFFEASYQARSWIRPNPPTASNITPVDSEFSLIIPKLGANAKVIKNVNPFDSREYQLALTKGIAHAAGSSLPGQNGSIFLFSHSSTDFYQALRYNSIFYLLNKLEPNDEMTIYYQSQAYQYAVVKKEITTPEKVEYLTNPTNEQTLALMTCWPPGTTSNRLIIHAKQIK